MILELEVRHPGDKEFMEKSFIWKTYFEKDVKSVGTSKMEVSEGFQVYCREGATHWRIQKLIDRREN